MRKIDQPIRRNRPGRVQVICAGCGIVFESIKSQIMRRKGGKFGGKLHTMECWKKWRRENRQSRLAKLLKQLYGMTEAEYKDLLQAQGGVCGICQCLPDTNGQPRLVVDHDHVTGRVRGLICRTCNLGLGHFKDNPTALASAIRYLDRHSAT